MSDNPVFQIECAWLVTWVHSGKELPLSKWLIAVRRSEISQDAIKEVVEACYGAFEASTGDKVRFIAEYNPYPAEINNMPDGRVSITCGHNPFVEARRVDNLRLCGDDAENLTLKYMDGGREKTVSDN